MNCVPGDIAIRVKSDGLSLIPVGAIVRVLRLYPGKRKGITPSGFCCIRSNIWHCEWHGKYTGHLGLPLGVEDSDLRPIRDPGNTAVDETLLRLPAPRSTKEEEHAA